MCGYSIWLLTGSWCADPQVILDAADAYDKYTSCWWNCEINTHTTVTTIVGGVVTSTAAWTVIEQAALPIKTAAETAISGNPYTSILSRIGNILNRIGFTGPGQIIRDHMRTTKTLPVGSQIGRSCVAGVAIFEVVVAWRCAAQCSRR